MFYNPLKMAVQKYMSELLKDKYGTHHHIVERISHYLATENDVREFGAMTGEIYQMGYLKAAGDFREKLHAAGITIDMSHDIRTTDGSQTGNS